MKQFMDKDFLLSNETAKTLYHEHAAKMPIIDYHCHISPKEIAENKKYNNITELWLGGDHYKWRQMRSNGVPEKYITGDASDHDKFIKWAETLQKAVGNPLYHWSHLELQRYFGFNKPLSPATAEECWKLCNEKLKNLTVRDIIEQSNVDVICTTDDPVDTLEWHQMIKADKSFKTRVIPAWRPDKAMNIEKKDYPEYIAKLEKKGGVKIDSFESLVKALVKCMDFFAENGCSVSDHALEYVMFKPATPEEIERIFKARLNGTVPSYEDELKFKTAFMTAMGKEYHRRDWVMQLHYGTKRDNNTLMFDRIGPDTGFDCINTNGSSAELAAFLNNLAKTDTLPKTIIYSLNPADNAAIGTVIGCFQDSTAVGKIQQGSAWWFNDNKTGMIDQMTSLANLGLLSNFIGMLTDSRSFLSYTRHEYFRRILCNMLGTWVENGEYPADLDFLGRMVEDVSYNNTKNYFKF